MRHPQDISDENSRDDFGPNLKPGCLYRTKNLCNDMRISTNTLDLWRAQGLKPLIESGHGTKADYWLADEIIEFLRRERDGGKPPT